MRHRERCLWAAATPSTTHRESPGQLPLEKIIGWRLLFQRFRRFLPPAPKKSTYEYHANPHSLPELYTCPGFPARSVAYDICPAGCHNPAKLAEKLLHPALASAAG